MTTTTTTKMMATSDNAIGCRGHWHRHHVDERIDHLDDCLEDSRAETRLVAEGIRDTLLAQQNEVRRELLTQQEQARSDLRAHVR